MSQYHHILFISVSNTCRGCMAEALMKQELVKRGISDVCVCSRGTVVLFPEPLNPKVITVLENNGVLAEETYQSKPLEREDIHTSDLIITMTQDQKEKILEQYPEATYVYTIKELGREQGEVLDPYGKDLIDYEYCCREIARLVEKIVDVFICDEKE